MPRHRRIIAGISGSPRCLPTLRYAADLARASDTALVLVHAWVPPALELTSYQFLSEELVQEWEDAARQRLERTLEMAVGGLPLGIPADQLIVRE